MEAPKVPELSAYDFLGYIVPGLASLFLADVSYRFHALHLPLTYDGLISRYGALSWPSLVPLILVAYFVGHMISFVSSITIERHATWLHGLPARVIIFGDQSGYLDTRASRSPRGSKALRTLVFLGVLPIAFVEVIAGKWLKLDRNYIKPADELIRRAFLRSLTGLLSRIGIKKDDISANDPREYELERLAIHCAMERAPMHIHTLRNYVVLFGFLRSMTLIVVLTVWFVVGHLIRMQLWWQAATAFLSGALISFTCYAAFMKFWFRYYFEAIMAIIASAAIPPKPEVSQND